MRRLLRDDRGAVSVIVVGALAFILAFAALAVDLGYIFLKARQMQGIADLAAIAAARDLENAPTAAEATVAANGWEDDIDVEIATGVYKADSAVAPAARFTAGVGPADAVRVTVDGDVDLFFGAVLMGRNTIRVTRTATAARAELAAFSLGSRLAAVNGGAANALLSALTGSQVSLSAMDYNTLASAEVDLFKYTRALATHAELEGVSFDTALESDFSTSEALAVFAEVLDEDGQVSAAAALNAIATAADDTTPAGLDRLFDLGPYGGQDHVSGGTGAGVTVGALDMANALLLLASEGRQVKVDLGASVPGLADTELWLAVGERPNDAPWMSIAADGSRTIRTAQTRLYLEVEAGTSGILGALGLAKVKLPLLVEVASAQAKLSSINCGAGTVGLSVSPSVGKLAIGKIDKTKLNDFQHDLTIGKADIAAVPLVKVAGSSQVELGGEGWQSVQFTKADIASGTVKTVSTNDLAQATAASLIGDLDLTVSVAGLGLILGKTAVTNAVASVLSTTAAPLDSLINGLTGLLGVHLGQADLRVGGIRCNDAALVA